MLESISNKVIGLYTATFFTGLIQIFKIRYFTNKIAKIRLKKNFLKIGGNIWKHFQKHLQALLLFWKLITPLLKTLKTSLLKTHLGDCFCSKEKYFTNQKLENEKRKRQARKTKVLLSSRLHILSLFKKFHYSKTICKRMEWENCFEKNSFSSIIKYGIRKIHGCWKVAKLKIHMISKYIFIQSK